MKQTILKYGLYSGAMGAALMTLTALYYSSTTEYENGQYIGFTGILLSMMFVYFGVKNYRDNVAGGALSFSAGFKVGLLIAIISCICYVIAWMLVSDLMMPDFMEKFMAQSLAQKQQSGASPEEIAKFTAEMAKYQEMYKNPVYKFLLTFIEPFPIALLVSLVSAGILRKSAD